MKYFVKQEMSFLTAVIRFNRTVFERESATKAGNSRNMLPVRHKYTYCWVCLYDGEFVYYINSISRTNHFKNYAMTYVRTHVNIMC
jgi:hypothetical protein